MLTFLLANKMARILEEMEELMEGSGWVNWKDGKDVALDSKSGPQQEYRPLKVQAR